MLLLICGANGWRAGSSVGDTANRVTHSKNLSDGGR
jgi:hypothetical protein